MNWPKNSSFALIPPSADNLSFLLLLLLRHSVPVFPISDQLVRKGASNAVDTTQIQTDTDRGQLKESPCPGE